MAKKNTTSRKSKSKARKSVLERINPNAAGIDIGANFHFMAIPEDRAEEKIRKFGPFTCDLHRLADWLAEHHIETNDARHESTNGERWLGLLWNNP
jgi:transposase